MSHEIPCPKCSAPNTVGSKFCSNCGSRLPPSTKIICPHCQTPNPRDRFYCDNCGKRLVEDSLPKDAPKSEQKGSPQRFSLPERDPDQPPAIDSAGLPDWLQTGDLEESQQEQTSDEESGDSLPASIEELAPLKKTTDELPDWLVDDMSASRPGFEPPKEITTDHFLELLQAAEDSPPELPDEMAKAASEADLPDWLSDVVTDPVSDPSQTIPAASPEPVASDFPGWETSPEDNVASWGQETDDEPEPDWLSELGSPQTSDLGDEEPISGVQKTSQFADSVLGGEELPDWLSELGPAQTTDLDQEAPPSDEMPVSMIFESPDFADEVKQTLGAGEIPDWLLEMEAAQEDAGEETDTEDELPPVPQEWMTKLAPIPDVPAAEDEIDELDALLAEDVAAAAEEADLPDWLSGLDTAELDEKPEGSTSFFLSHSPGSRPLEEAQADEDTDAADEQDAARLDELLTEIEADSIEAAEPAATLAADQEAIEGWLADLEETPPEAVQEPEAVPDADDWLAEPEETPPDAEVVEEPDTAFDAEEWLVELDEDPAAVEPELPAGDLEEDDQSVDDLFAMFEDEAMRAGDESEDWLAELGPVETTALADAAAEEDAAGEFFEDLSDATGDWLEELGPVETTALDEAEEQLPGLFDAEGPGEETVESSGELPDWLSELGPVQTNILTPSPADEDSAAPVAEDEIGADLSDIFSFAEEADEVLPDWLHSEETEDTEETAVSEAAEPPTAEAAEIVEDEAGEEESFAEIDALFASEFETETEDVEEEPDWLAEITALGPEALTSELGESIDEPESAVSVADPAVLDDIFDLAASQAVLGEAGAENDLYGEDFLSDSPVETAEEAETAAADDLSGDFGPLLTFDDTGELEPAAVEEDLFGAEDTFEFDDEAAEVPEWLTQLGPPSATDTPAPAAAESGDDELVVEELPEWLSHMKPETDSKISSMPGLAEQKSIVDESFEKIPDELIGADLPDWLEGATQTSLADEEGSEDGLGMPDDLPEWLRAGLDDGQSIFDEDEMSEITTQLSELLEELPPARDPLAELAKADIPDWVQAMKPRELTTDGPEEAPELPLQESGPLGGIRGVIEVEPVVAATYESGITFNEFSVTKEQQKQATLLRQLSYGAQEEEEATQLGTVGAASTITRLVLALLLLATIVAGLLGPNIMRAEMGAPGPNLESFNRAVTGAAGQPVVLALEYTPALSAEISPQVELLLQQLKANGSEIIPVTQHAAAVGLAAAMSPDFVIAEPFLIPGEAIGLRELGNCLQEPCATIAGHTLANYEDVNLRELLNETALVIVFTGERDSLVNWIEQVGLPNREIPLLVGVPQAMAPVAIPYTASGQIAGSINGLDELAQYQEAFEAEAANDLANLLNAQQLAQLLVVVLLLGGGFMSIITRPRTGRKQQKVQTPHE